MKYYGQVPKAIADLIILGGEMEQGVTKDGQALEIKQITAAQMKTSTDGVVATDKAFNTSRSAQETAYQNFHTADDALSVWLGKATGALSAFFGKRWNRQWVQVGFVNPSIAIPSTITDRLALALRMISFLASNPGYEAPNQGVTAAAGTTLRDAAIATQALAVLADADLTSKGTARGAAVDALTSMMRLLIGLLSELLNADDTRWLDFGLSIPATRGTPAAPTGLTVTANPQLNTRMGAADSPMASVLLTWNASPEATRYRVRMRIVGVQGDYQLAASTTEPIATVATPADAAVEFIVQAVNGNRQSVPSEPVVYQPVVATQADAQPVTRETPAATANGSNGHANGSRLAALPG